MREGREPGQSRVHSIVRQRSSRLRMNSAELPVLDSTRMSVLDGYARNSTEA